MSEESRIRSAIFYFIFAVFLAALLLVLRPFFQPLLIALICSALIYPVYKRLVARKVSSVLSAVVCVLLIILLVVIPFTYVISQVFEELMSSLESLKAVAASGLFEKVWGYFNGMLFVPQARQLVSSNPALSSIDLFGMTYRLGESVARYLASNSIVLIRNVAWFLTEVFLVLITVFFILADSQKLLKVIREFSPFKPRETEQLLNKVNDTVFATVFGGILVALAQGMVGGIGFFILGLPSPVLWGSAMGLLAMIPFLGAPVVWFPAAVILLLQGQIAKAVFLFIWGAFVVGLIDNFLRPYIVGSRTQLHPLLVFFSAFGGLFLMGPLGLFIGPIILCVTLTLAAFFRERTSS